MTSRVQMIRTRCQDTVTQIEAQVNLQCGVCSWLVQPVRCNSQPIVGLLATGHLDHGSLAMWLVMDVLGTDLTNAVSTKANPRQKREGPLNDADSVVEENDTVGARGQSSDSTAPADFARMAIE